MSDNKKFLFEKLEKRRTEALARKTFAILKDLMESPVTEAYDSVRADGYAAREAGKPISSNPHKPGSIESKVWKNSWEQAHDDAKKDADDKFYAEATQENPEIATLKKEIADHEQHMSNSENSDDFYYTNGGHDRDSSTLFGLKKRLEDLKAKDQEEKTQNKAAGVKESVKAKDLTKESAPPKPKKVKVKTNSKKRLARLYTKLNGK